MVVRSSIILLVRQMIRACHPCSDVYKYVLYYSI
jgi:hypothetical protein